MLSQHYFEVHRVKNAVGYSTVFTLVRSGPLYAVEHSELSQRDSCAFASVVGTYNDCCERQRVSSRKGELVSL